MGKYGKPLDAVPGRTRAPGKAKDVIDEFLESKAKAWEVKNWAKPISVATSLRNYARSSKTKVAVVTRGDKVYLTRP